MEEKGLTVNTKCDYSPGYNIDVVKSSHMAIEIKRGLSKQVESKQRKCKAFDDLFLEGKKNGKLKDSEYYVK